MSGKLDQMSQNWLEQKGCQIKTVKEGMGDKKLAEIIRAGLEVANNKAISRAQRVQNFTLLSEDFSVESGLLTPTLKLKRREVVKKYEGEIEKMYMNASL